MHLHELHSLRRNSRKFCQRPHGEISIELLKAQTDGVLTATCVIKTGDEIERTVFSEAKVNMSGQQGQKSHGYVDLDDEKVVENWRIEFGGRTEPVSGTDLHNRSSKLYRHLFIIARIYLIPRKVMQRLSKSNFSDTKIFPD